MMISWTDKFGGFYTRFIDWIGFGSQRTVVPEPVLSGSLALLGKSGSLIINTKAGSLSNLNPEGNILNVVSGQITSIKLHGVITLKEQ